MNDVLDEILSGLETGMGDTISKYYKGEVILVPRSYLPALMIFGTSTTITAKSTSKDICRYAITIRVVQSAPTKFTEEGTGDIIKAQEDLINIMEGRGAGGVLETDTVAGVLRQNLRGVDYLYNVDLDIEYKTLQQGEFFYISADLNLTAVTDLVLRP